MAQRTVTEIHTTGGRSFKVGNSMGLRAVKGAIESNQTLPVESHRDDGLMWAWFNLGTVAAITSYPVGE